MTFLSPVGLLWLAAVPVLVWFWRLASTRHQTRISSLVPFEHLLRRPPRRRRRLFVNVLFWCQLAALCLLALALMQPVLRQPRARTILVVMDTSASLGAQLRGPSAFERAKRLLRSRIGKKRTSDQVFIVTTAPVAPVINEPTSDAVRLRQAVETITVSHLAGNLGTAAQIGRALLGGPADQTLIITDEPPPQGVAAKDVEWLTVNQPMPNVAIVGLEAQGPLCSEAPARVAVTLQNFSNDPSRLRLTAARDGQVVGDAEVSLEARERRSVALALTEATDGWVALTLQVPRDALAVDNHAHVMVRRAATLPVAVVSEDPGLRSVLGQWLNACEGLVWTEGQSAPAATPLIVVTDQPARLSASPAGQETAFIPQVVGALEFLTPKPSAQARLAHWMVAGDHPIGSYLPAVEPVSASLSESLQAVAVGEPVVWGLVRGRKVPVVLAGETEGRRTVSFFVDPTASPASTPLLVLFYNSLRWLMGQADVVRTGHPLLISSVDAGPLAVRRPDGTVQRFLHDGGTFRYDDTTEAGTYYISSGGRDIVRAVNFLDPLESNLMERASTWRPAPGGAAVPAASPTASLPLAHLVVLLVLMLLAVEWRLYGARPR